MPKLLNKRTDKIPRDAIYIGRPGKWGNPFYLRNESEREIVLERYKKWLDENPQIKAAAIKELRGKDLVCWCAPKLCHGDVLLQLANEDYISLE